MNCPAVAGQLNRKDLLIAAAVAFVAVLLAIAAGNGIHPTPYDNYGLQAQAWLTGHLDLPQWPGPAIDAVLFEQRRYSVEAPLPAVLLVPLIALHLDPALAQTLLGYVMLMLIAAATYVLARTLGCTRPAALLIASTSICGTDILWCAAYGDVWLIAHLGAVAFVTLGLLAYFCTGRLWLVGLLFACAMECRLPEVLAVVTLPVLFPARNEKLRLGDLLGYIIPVALFAGAHIAYDVARWHSPWEIGYSVFAASDPSHIGKETFGLSNVGRDAWMMMLAPLGGSFGAGLFWTSPWLAASLFARGRTPAALGICALAAAIPSFLYYDTGGWQFGNRHALDFLPFFFAIIAYWLARTDRIPKLFVLTAALSCSIGISGTLWWTWIIRGVR